MSFCLYAKLGSLINFDGDSIAVTDKNGVCYNMNRSDFFKFVRRYALEEVQITADSDEIELTCSSFDWNFA